MESYVLETHIRYYETIFSSYHKPVFLNLDTKRYFEANTTTIQPRAPRILSCSDPQQVKRLTEEVILSVESQVLYTRFRLLATRIREMKEPTEGAEKELDGIDIAFTKIILKAERYLKSCPRNNQLGNFSAELDIVLWEVKYWRKRVTALS